MVINLLLLLLFLLIFLLITPNNIFIKLKILFFNFYPFSVNLVYVFIYILFSFLINYIEVDNFNIFCNIAYAKGEGLSILERIQRIEVHEHRIRNIDFLNYFRQDQNFETYYQKVDPTILKNWFEIQLNSIDFPDINYSNFNPSETEVVENYSEIFKQEIENYYSKNKFYKIQKEEILVNNLFAPTRLIQQPLLITDNSIEFLDQLSAQVNDLDYKSRLNLLLSELDFLNSKFSFIDFKEIIEALIQELKFIGDISLESYTSFHKDFIKIYAGQNPSSYLNLINNFDNNLKQVSLIFSADYEKLKLDPESLKDKLEIYNNWTHIFSTSEFYKANLQAKANLINFKSEFEIYNNSCIFFNQEKVKKILDLNLDFLSLVSSVSDILKLINENSVNENSVI